MVSPVTNLVEEIIPESPAQRAGVLKGDRIISINKNKINDGLDLVFFSQESKLEIKLVRNRKNLSVNFEKSEYEDPGIVLEPLKTHICNNNCIFCFVGQLPKGLRRSLYLKDEDYRMSFLYGNYVTLSNLSQKDRLRIVEQRLSPLYVSVHTTNPALRQLMLGNKKGVSILEDLEYFVSSKIKFHAQIVLCPGYNDNEELEKTIRDLSRFYPYMMSIAVVPVGLTKHRKKPLNPVLPEDAANAILLIDKFRKRFIKKYGDPLVYAADELYIKAGLPFASVRQYGDLPQIENGVGMVPLFLHGIKSLKLSAYKPSDRRFITFTGTSFYPFLSNVIKKVRERTAVRIDLVPVTNNFFGESVTVAGLLTGRDIIRALSDKIDDIDTVLLPDIVLRDSSTVLLDDIDIEDIGTALGREIRVIEATPAGLLKGMEEKK